MINKDSFYFLQVGANDGKTNDPLYPYVTKYGLSGCLVEPQKDVFEILKETYSGNQNLIFENVAISIEDGSKDIYSIKHKYRAIYEQNSENAKATGVTSFDKNHLLKNLQKKVDKNIDSDDLDEYIDVDSVKTMTISTLLTKNKIDHVDFL